LTSATTHSPGANAYFYTVFQTNDTLITVSHGSADIVVRRHSKSKGNGNFGVSELRNPWTDLPKIWHRDYVGEM